MSRFSKEIKDGYGFVKEFTDWCDGGHGWSSFDMPMKMAVLSYKKALEDYMTADCPADFGETFQNAHGNAVERVHETILSKREEHKDHGEAFLRLDGLMEELSRHGYFAKQIGSGFQAARLLKRKFVRKETFSNAEAFLQGISLLGTRPTEELMEDISLDKYTVDVFLDKLLWLEFQRESGYRNAGIPEETCEHYREHLLGYLYCTTPSIHVAFVALVCYQSIRLQQSDDETSKTSARLIAKIMATYDGTPLGNLAKLTVPPGFQW